MGQQAGQAYSQFLQPPGSEQYEDVFNKSVMDPTMKQFNEQVLPSIQQRFVDSNAGSSSALNQALARSAEGLGSGLGQEYGRFFQNQQDNQFKALSGLGGLATQQQFQPMVGQSQGLLGSLLSAMGQVGAGFAAKSSEKVKENIKDFKKIGLKDVKKFEVKQYDYIKEVGGQKDKIGLIAENIPEELTTVIDGILHVDLYALISVLVNSVQELDDKIHELEKK